MVLRPAVALRQLGDQEAHVGVELLEVGVAVGDDLREEGVEVAEGHQPAAELLALLGAVLVLAALLEPLHGLVEPGVQLGVVAGRLARLGREEDAAEALDLVVVVDLRGVELGLQGVELLAASARSPTSAAS